MHFDLGFFKKAIFFYHLMKDVISVTNSNPHVIYRMQFMQFPFDISFILCEFPCENKYASFTLQKNVLFPVQISNNS